MVSLNQSCKIMYLLDIKINGFFVVAFSFTYLITHKVYHGGFDREFVENYIGT